VLSVLIVEDEAVLRKYLARAMSGAGFDVATAGSRAEAEARLRERSFGVLLLDVRLPDGNGLDLLGALAPDCRPAQTVLMTAEAGAECEHRAAQLRVACLLHQPFDLEQALAALAPPCDTLPAAGSPLPPAL
jgi:DNA-binding NtrC family response regulator